MKSTQFQESVVNMQSNMFNFALMLTGDRNEACDLLQETTLKALDNEDKYVDNVNFKGWMLTIMRNCFINNYRRIVRHQTVLDLSGDFYHLNLSQDSGFDSPDSAYTIKEINQAIHRLNGDLKVPFSLFLAGYQYNEIAQRLSLPLGTIKSRIFFARKELQRKLYDMLN
ncbi:RNA polymerase sigma factor [Bacteroidia bacterium]|nr:RNA polymerase sigma factor [Bacteroidia bacterium]GHU67941.1 RNA polymerase sigma factor [Bacteroidia bacterium]